MENIELSLNAPASINLRELADSTTHLYKLLRPWCFSEQTNLAIFKPIRLQALSYVQALDFSITAAQNGFNFCEDAMAFLKLFNASDQMQQQEYLQGLVELAQEAEDNAAKAQARFRNARIIVRKLVQEAKKQQSSSSCDPTSSNDQQLKEFEQGVCVLERFSVCISAYITWWNTVHMVQKAQSTRQNQVKMRYNVYRSQDILKKWEELRQEYIFYTYKIQLIQDANPDFHLLLKEARLEVLPPTVQSLQSNSDYSNDSARSVADAEPVRMKQPYAEGSLSTQTPRKKFDGSSYESRTFPRVEPTTMLFAPIAFATRSPPNQSGIMGKRNRILQTFGIKRGQ